jgi:hypothetical protein
MATTYCNELSGITSFPQVQALGNLQGAGVVCFQSTITLASQVSTSVIVLAQPQAGLVYIGAEVLVSVTLGSSTLAITGQTSGNTYAAAATYTASANVLPTTASLALGALTAQDTVIATVGAATLPSSGTCVILTYWMTANG